MKFLQIASLVAFASACNFEGMTMKEVIACEKREIDMCLTDKDFMLKNRKFCN